jgi:hypothetical protein
VDLLFGQTEVFGLSWRKVRVFDLARPVAAAEMLNVGRPSENSAIALLSPS